MDPKRAAGNDIDYADEDFVNEISTVHEKDASGGYSPHGHTQSWAEISSNRSQDYDNADDDDKTFAKDADVDDDEKTSTSNSSAVERALETDDDLNVSRDDITYLATHVPFSLSYGTGGLIGQVGTDSLGIGNNISVPNTHVGLATHMGKFFHTARFDGVFGLGFPRLSRVHSEPPLYTMFRLGVLEKPVFSFWVKEGKNGQHAGGEVVLGGINSKRFEGQGISIPVIRKMYWEVELTGLLINENPVPTISSQTAIIDTGTSLIVLPAADADAVNQFLGAVPLFNEYGLYAIDCHKNNKPTVTFVLAGETFAIKPTHYIIPVGKNRCVTAFSASTSPDLNRWVIGNSFLRAWHTTFDVEKFEIKLSKAVQIADGSKEAQDAESSAQLEAASASVSNRLQSIIDSLTAQSKAKTSSAKATTSPNGTPVARVANTNSSKKTPSPSTSSNSSSAEAKDEMEIPAPTNTHVHHHTFNPGQATLPKDIKHSRA
ncbi:aspartic proteinase precursor [Coemansia sp. RSA 1933]|nr:aspartic proteinase precursor [Coemansia sp. RSA 1933]